MRSFLLIDYILTFRGVFVNRIDKIIPLGYNLQKESEKNMDILKMKSGNIADTKEKFNKRREEIKNFLASEVYGRIPAKPEHLGADIESEDRGFGGGIGILRSFKLRITLDGEVFNLPFRSVVPSGEGKHPTIIYIGYDSAIPSKYLPAEEIVERGYGIFSLSLTDIFPEGSKQNKLFKRLVPIRKRKDSPGQIALLAWLISRIADYAAHQSYVDEFKLGVAGHGLLARAALVAGGYDERFNYVILNSLEFGQKYLSRPELFAKCFADGDGECFDDLALALCVPRTLIVGAATLDVISEREKEFYALNALNAPLTLFEKSGIKADCKEEEFTAAGDSVFYRLRDGTPYFSRRDWNAYMDYIDSKEAKNAK